MATEKARKRDGVFTSPMTLLSEVRCSQRDSTAGCINGSDKVAFRHQIRFGERFDPVHARTTALDTVTVKQIERLQSQKGVRIG
jgi:hypothetical protein